MTQYEIIYSGIQDWVKESWDIKKIEKIIKKLNVEKKTVHVSETYNEVPLLTIKLLGESLDIGIDSMGTKHETEE